MASGILGSATTVNATPLTAYTCPTGKVAYITIHVTALPASSLSTLTVGGVAIFATSVGFVASTTTTSIPFKVVLSEGQLVSITTAASPYGGKCYVTGIEENA